MRMWIGKEKEGAKNTFTIFVEEERFTISKILKVLEVAEKFSITRIYLGANRRNVKCLGSEGMELFKSRKMEVVMETDRKGYNHAVECRPDKIIFRTELSDAPNFSNLILKIDNMKTWCAVSNSLTFTDITNLKNGMYETDMEVQ